MKKRTGLAACLFALCAATAVMTTGCSDDFNANEPPHIAGALEAHSCTAAGCGGSVSSDTPQCVRFTASATDSEGSELTYKMDYGDGDRSQGCPGITCERERGKKMNVCHEYRRAGNFKAVLHVVDEDGDIDLATVNVSLSTPATVSFARDIYPLFSFNGKEDTGCQASSCHLGVETTDCPEACAHCEGACPSGCLPVAGCLDLAIHESPDDIYSQLTKPGSGRIDTAPGQACNSLLLMKPASATCTGSNFAHTGGRIWPVGSPEYTTVKQWIENGAPNN